MTTYEGVDNLALTHIAEGVIPVLISEEQHATAELVAELAGRVNNLDAALVERDLHAELAQEGIGQTPPIVLIVGMSDNTSRGDKAFWNAWLELTHTGHIVINHYVRPDEDPELMVLLLDQKLRLADLIHVHNPDTYLNPEAAAIVEAAKEAGVPVQYLIDPDQ